MSKELVGEHFLADSNERKGRLRLEISL